MPELPPSRATKGALEGRHSGQLVEFDPVVARRNRRWMMLILLPALFIGAAALIATVIASHNSHSVPPSNVPAGYRSVSDGYFGYAVPASWSQNGAYTDDVGDLDMSGRTGWAGEHVGARADPPTTADTPPAALATFGEPRSTAYHLTGVEPTSVPGATTAFRYQMTRPEGFHATVIDAWQSQSGAEIWLVVRADSATTATIVASLKG
jgi:hypothetical protein